MSKNKVLLLFLLLSFSIISCTPDAEEILEANNLPMKGTQVVPSNNSSATGTITAKYNKATRVLDYTVTWTGLSSDLNGMRFYKGSRNTNGPAVKNIQSSGSTTGSITESWTVPDSLGTTLEQNGLYINIQTENYPNGEIRGQLDF
ncbi:MAG: CHRD domain-containing protein [Saprospiraceae bacterium]|nr:CHRD domain-containing protein [Saprospiraceae bacterium]